MTGRFGGSQEAAAVLDVSRAQLDRMRRAAAYVYDPASGATRRMTGEEAGDRKLQRTLHLIAPSLQAQKLPGGSWEFRLDRLQAQREDPGWNGQTDP